MIQFANSFSWHDLTSMIYEKEKTVSHKSEKTLSHITVPCTCKIPKSANRKTCFVWHRRRNCKTNSQRISNLFFSSNVQSCFNNTTRSGGPLPAADGSDRKWRRHRHVRPNQEINREAVLPRTEDGTWVVVEEKNWSVSSSFQLWCRDRRDCHGFSSLLAQAQPIVWNYYY